MNRISWSGARLAVAAVLALGLTHAVGAESLRFGVLPAVDAVPYLVAADEGLFAAQGLVKTSPSVDTLVDRRPTAGQ